MALLLTLLLAAGPDCSTSTDAGTVINCGGAKVLVSIAPGTPAQALPGVVQGMERLYTSSEKKDVEVQLGKAKHKGVELTLFASPKDKKIIGTARITAVTERENLSRVLVCVTEPQVPVENCQRGFEMALTVQNPKPPEAELPESSSTWSGVALATPPGCKSNAPGSIQCKTASMMWGDRPADGPLNSQQMVAEMALRQMPQGTTKIERSCVIDSKGSTCSVLKSSANGAPFNIVIGLAEIKGRWTSFQCIVLGELKDALPAPCDQIVRLVPAK